VQERKFVSRLCRSHLYADPPTRRSAAPPLRRPPPTRRSADPPIRRSADPPIRRPADPFLPSLLYPNECPNRAGFEYFLGHLLGPHPDTSVAGRVSWIDTVVDAELREG